VPALSADRRKEQTFRFTLRRATAARHAALDSHPALAALAAGRLDLEGYRRLMAAFHGFYLGHDPMVAEACRFHGLERHGFVYAPRSNLIAGDLASLGIPPVPLGHPAMHPIASAASLAGLLYVIEGSMLGGGVLSRSTAALLARNNARGDSYWQWCRDAGASRWAMTCRMIEEIAANEEARREMIAGAEAAFDAFGDWLRDFDAVHLRADALSPSLR
jgi:heme oxygenase